MSEETVGQWVPDSSLDEVYAERNALQSENERLARELARVKAAAREMSARLNNPYVGTLSLWRPGFGMELVDGTWRQFFATYSQPIREAIEALEQAVGSGGGDE